MKGASWLGVAILMACFPPPSFAQVGAAEPAVEQLPRRWVVGQLMAEHALLVPHVSGSAMDPATVLVDRVDSIAASSRLIRLTVFGQDAGGEYSLLTVGARIFRLAGFKDPQVLEAWSALSGSGQVSCDQVRDLILRGLDPNGGGRVVYPGRFQGQSQSPVLSRFRDVIPQTWPLDTTIMLGNSGRLQVTTVLSLQKGEYPEGKQMWSPIAYSTVLESDCRLTGWSARVAPSIQVEKVAGQ
jgi:hypothetical protein